MNTPMRMPSRRLCFDDAIVIWRKLLNKEFQNRIAAEFDVNPARVAEIKKGLRFPGSREAALRQLGLVSGV